MGSRFLGCSWAWLWWWDRWDCGEPARVVHKSTGRVLGFAEAVGSMVDEAELDRAVADRKTAVVGLGDAHRLDAEVVRWFREQGRGYQTRINAVLRAYYEAVQRGR